MKPNIHPKYNKLLVQLPRGDSFETYSTYSQDKLILDVDFRNHPAWTKKGISSANASSAKVSKFNKKFGNINFSNISSDKKSKSQESKPVEKEESKAEELKHQSDAEKSEKSE